MAIYLKSKTAKEIPYSGKCIELVKIDDSGKTSFMILQVGFYNETVIGLRQAGQGIELTEYVRAGLIETTKEDYGTYVEALADLLK